jgi:hypothetical protein
MTKTAKSIEEARVRLNERRRKRYKSDHGEDTQALLLRLSNFTAYSTAVIGLKAKGSDVVFGAGKAYTKPDLSKIMGHKTNGVVRKWLKQGLLPSLHHTAKLVGSEERVYVWTAAEMKIIVGSLKEHFTEAKYYGCYHKKVANSMKDAIKEKRKA